MRALHADAGLPFLEVWVVHADRGVRVAATPRASTPGRASGEIPHMTGVDDPYEPPESPELEVTDRMECDAAVERLLALLAERGVR